MKKYAWLTILTALVLALACIGTVCAEVIPPDEPGQQIGYVAMVLCEELSLREKPSTSSKALHTLHYGEGGPCYELSTGSGDVKVKMA